MSATAFLASQHGMTIMADGIGYDLKVKDRIFCTDYQKLTRLTDKCAMVWMGLVLTNTDGIVESVKGCDSKEAIYKIAEQIKTIVPYSKNIQEHIKRCPYSITTHGYRNGKGEAWRLNSDHTDFEPELFLEVKPGGMVHYSHVVGMEDHAPWGELIASAWDKEKKFPTARDFVEYLESVTQSTFLSMINEHKKKGHHVGGQIFIETLTPH